MGNELVHEPLPFLFTEKGRDPEKLLEETVEQLRRRHAERQALEEELKKDPMLNLKLALVRGNPNRSRKTWSLSNKKKRW